MTDKILQRYTSKVADNGVESSATDEVENADDLGAFGWLRGVHERAIMLELRMANGNVVAIGYSWLEKVVFDPSEGITLHAGGQKIKIKGRNLNGEVRPNVRLFRGITRHKVPWVQEADERAAMHATRGATVVEAIE